MKISSKSIMRNNDFLSVAVWGMMCARGGNKAEEIAKLFGITPGEEYEVDLKLTANGVELDFKEFMNTLKHQHNDMIERDAKDQIRARVSMMLDHLNEIVQEAERLALEEVEETFPGKKVF